MILTMHPSLSALVLTVVVGLIVGTINAMAGGASIISYPVLLALGLAPINAAITNALGVSSANFFALGGSKKRFKDLFYLYRMQIIASVICSIIGALLLLSMPPGVFEKIVPFLLLGATLTFLIPVGTVRKLKRKSFETLLIGASGLYCGYFGPGQGVMVVAALARDSESKTKDLNGAKNIIVGITSLASNLIYIFSGKAQWWFVVALLIGSSLGGIQGGRWAKLASPEFYRRIVFIVGMCASLWLFVKYFF